MWPRWRPSERRSILPSHSDLRRYKQHSPPGTSLLGGGDGTAMRRTGRPVKRLEVRATTTLSPRGRGIMRVSRRSVLASIATGLAAGSAKAGVPAVRQKGGVLSLGNQIVVGVGGDFADIRDAMQSITDSS